MLSPSHASRSENALDSALVDKARTLRKTVLFVDPSEGSELIHKQAIFLVLAGLKPVSEVSSGHWAYTSEGRHTVADDPATVEQFLSMLGLTYDLEALDYVTNATVALTRETLDAYEGRAPGSGPAGQFLGYPDTAITAFVENCCVSREKQDRIEKKEQIDDYAVPFRFSEDHWRAEVLVARQWRDTLAAYGLL